MERASIAAVATRAGVSRTTVSHALSGRRSVAPATRARILTIIDELGYRPDHIAQSLRSQRTLSVALIVTDLSNPYYPALAKGLNGRLDAEGYALIIGETQGHRGGERRVVEQMLARRVDGIVMQMMSTTPEDLRRLVGGLPLVTIGAQPAASSCDAVVTDDAHGIAEVMAHLASRRYVELAFVSGPENTPPGTTRLQAAVRAARECGLRLDTSNVVFADFTRDAGRQAALELLRRGDERPRAVVCANDLIAIGVLDAARQLGLDVPGELAVVGFDDIDMAGLLTPALTTVSNPAAAVGRACAEAILARMSEPSHGARRPFAVTTLPTSLTIRESA